MKLTSQEIKQKLSIPDYEVDYISNLDYQRFKSEVYLADKFNGEERILLSELWKRNHPIQNTKQPRDYKPKPDYVYLLSSDVGLYKIGFSNDVKPRVRRLNKELPVTVKEVFSIECENGKELEAYLHTELAHKRLAGEWFVLSDEDSEMARNLANGFLARRKR